MVFEGIDVYSVSFHSVSLEKVERGSSMECFLPHESTNQESSWKYAMKAMQSEATRLHSMAYKSLRKLKSLERARTSQMWDKFLCPQQQTLMIDNSESPNCPYSIHFNTWIFNHFSPSPYCMQTILNDPNLVDTHQTFQHHKYHCCS